MIEFIYNPLSTTAAILAIAASLVSLLALIALHLLSPEFSPSWRMVSEYANGNHGRVLMIVFFAWAASSLAIFVALLPLSASWPGKIGLALLLMAAVGQIMGGLFDINHPLHGPAALFGIPSTCIAAILLNIALKATPGIAAPPVWTSWLPLISLVLMVGTVFLFFSALKAAGVTMAPGEGPLKDLPANVQGYVGWANRLLFAACYLWVILASLSVIRAASQP